MPRAAIALTRRAGPDQIEVLEPLRRLERVTLDEAEWIARLRHDVDAGHVEASAVQAHRGSASAAEQVESLRSIAHSRSNPRSARSSSARMVRGLAAAMKSASASSFVSVSG